METEVVTEEPLMKPCEPVDFLDILIAILWPLIIIAVFCLINKDLVHWFVLPLYFCGVLIGVDAIHWLRGKTDIYDPKGIIGVLGCHFFVSAPLLVAHLTVERVGRVYVDDWRTWLGYVAFFNAGGLILYQWSQSAAYKKPVRSAKTYWALNSGRVSIVIPVVLAIVLFSHAFFMIKLGGLGGLLAVKTYGFGAVDVAGLGPIMVFGRSIPMLVFISLTIWWYRKLNRSSNIFVVGFILFLFLIMQFLTAGLTGSRGATMWGIFWAAGIVHFFWRPIPIKWVLLAMAPFLLFMYLYSFYKDLGIRAFDLFKGRATIEALSVESERTFSGMLIGDLSRADVQAAQLHVLVDKPWDYRYRLGSTYLTSVIPLIPRKLWPTKPDDTGKVIAGTEMLYGPETYQSIKTSVIWTGRRSTRIFALAGEAMLNFGIFGILPAFAVWGYIVGRIRRRLLSYRFGDMRLLTAPFLVNLCFLMLMYDLANIAAVTLFKWAIPALVVYLVSVGLPVWNTEAESVDITQSYAIA